MRLGFALFAFVVAGVSVAAPDPDAVWPSFRHDTKNTGRSTIVPYYNGGVPWRYKTQRGIFSTPVIDGEEQIYIGSADNNFYVLNRNGELLWHFQTEQVFDSAALLSVENGEPVVTIPSGDGHLYQLSRDLGIEDAQARVRWSFDSTQHPSSKRVGYNWFEGNVVQGPGGTIYAGSTNWMYYALSPSTGDLLWSLETGNMNWSAGAFASNGDVFWTSLDGKVRRVNPRGEVLWEKRTWGVISASVALDEHDNAYVGSSDNTFYAFDQNGDRLWQFKTRDHIYDSAALGVDESGATNRIYVTSADGFLYCLDTKGVLVWKYDVGDVIRSSPAIAPKPEGESGDVIYFGAADGRLYAINSEGTLRWAFDTTPYDDPEIVDRNDLNASPALGKDGIYVAGEHGFIWHIPYDYALSYPEDPRVMTQKVEAQDGATMRFVSAGGQKMGQTAEVGLSQVLNLELVVSHRGERIDAGLKTGLMPGHHLHDIITITPKVPFELEKSADGHFVHIRPQNFWQPDTTYTITVDGTYVWDGLSFGAIELALFGKDAPVKDTLTFTTPAVASEPLPIAQGEAFRIRRMAIPMPAMMTSLNQIGFDSYDFVATPLWYQESSRGQGKFVLWVMGVQRDANGGVGVDKNTDFFFVMNGDFWGNAFAAATRNTSLSVSNINVPLDFELRGELQPDFSIQHPSLYGEVSMWSDAVYGPMLVLAGLINKSGVMPVSGTYLTSELSESSMLKQRSDLCVDQKQIQFHAPSFFSEGFVEVPFERSSYVAREHMTALVLINPETGEDVKLNYKEALSESEGSEGHLLSVRLTLPARTDLPRKLELLVISDAHVLERVRLR